MKIKEECLIIAGGEENDISRKFKSGLENVFVIACDKGCEYALHQGVWVDYACGDFDSANEKALNRIKKSTSVEILPTHKDDTDLIYGIKQALKQPFKKLFITCAVGGRLDHFLSNIQGLVFAKENSLPGTEICFYDDFNEIHIVKNESISIEKKENYSLSVLSWTDISKGVTIKGAEYELDQAELRNSFPLGQSNVITADKISISVLDGILLVIESKLK